MRRFVEGVLARRALLAGPDPTPAQEAAATERLYHDLKSGAGDAPPAPATDTTQPQDRGESADGNPR